MLAPLRGESDSASAAFAPPFPARRHRCARRPQSREFFMTAAPAQTLSFADLGVPARIVDALVAVDRPTPFPIQTATLPSTLAGRDVLGRGKTGSGKTLAFAIRREADPPPPDRPRPRSDPRARHADREGRRTARGGRGPYRHDRLRRRLATSAGAGVRARRRHRRRVPRPARGPHRPEDRLARPRADHRARRGRPHG